MKILKILLPPLILAAGIFGAWALMSAKSEPVQTKVEHTLPTVEVIIAKL